MSTLFNTINEKSSFSGKTVYLIPLVEIDPSKPSVGKYAIQYSYRPFKGIPYVTTYYYDKDGNMCDYDLKNVRFLYKYKYRITKKEYKEIGIQGILDRIDSNIKEAMAYDLSSPIQQSLIWNNHENNK